jgi:hypothetical protein
VQTCDTTCMTSEASTVRPSQVEVRTSRYEFAHGKKPRGHGRWGFYNPKDESIEAIFWSTNLYGIAKLDAADFFAVEGVTLIYVAT